MLQPDGAGAVSPFRRASQEIPRSSDTDLASTPNSLNGTQGVGEASASPSGTEPHSSPPLGDRATSRPRPQPKSLRFQDTQPAVYQDKAMPGKPEGQAAAESGSDSSDPGDDYRIGERVVDGAVHVHTPDSSK